MCSDDGKAEFSAATSPAFSVTILQKSFKYADLLLKKHFNWYKQNCWLIFLRKQ